MINKAGLLLKAIPALLIFATGNFVLPPGDINMQKFRGDPQCIDVPGEKDGCGC